MCLWLGATVEDAAPPLAAGGPWTVMLGGAPPLEAAAVVLATGGGDRARCRHGCSEMRVTLRYQWVSA